MDLSETNAWSFCLGINTRSRLTGSIGEACVMCRRFQWENISEFTRFKHEFDTPIRFPHAIAALEQPFPGRPCPVSPVRRRLFFAPNFLHLLFPHLKILMGGTFLLELTRRQRPVTAPGLRPGGRPACRPGPLTRRQPGKSGRRFSSLRKSQADEIPCSKSPVFFLCPFAHVCGNKFPVRPAFYL